jgi:ankyrin repeat protein
MKTGKSHKKKHKKKRTDKSKKRKRPDREKESSDGQERKSKRERESDKMGIDIGQSEKKGKSPSDFERKSLKKHSKLLKAIMEGSQSDVLYRIFSGGVDLNRHDLDIGNTPLHVACQRGAVEILEVLLEHGARVGDQNNLGLTGLHICVKKDFASLAQLLINKGANPHLEDFQGVSAAAMGLDLLLQEHARVEREALDEKEEELRAKMKDDEKEVGSVFVVARYINQLDSVAVLL